MTDEIKVNLLTVLTDADGQDSIVALPQQAISTMDGPQADALARTNQPGRVLLSRFVPLQGVFSNSARAGYAYLHDNGVWLAVRDTTQQPSRTSTDWYHLTSSGTYQGNWLAGTTYMIGDVVRDGGEFYRCAQNHLSGNDRQQDQDLGRWLPDTLPSFISVQNDDFGVNTSPDAVLHAMSYQNHPHADQVLKMERFEDGDVFLNISSNGSERGQIGYTAATDSIDIQAAESGGIRFMGVQGANYRAWWRVVNERLEPVSNNQSDIGSPSRRVRNLYADHIPSVSIFANEADRAATIISPITGQLSQIGGQLQHYDGTAWVNSIATPTLTLLNLTDTPGVYGSPGSRLVVGRDGAGFGYEAGPVPPNVGDGWEYAALRAVAATNPETDASNFVMVDPEDNAGFIVGQRYIEPVTHTLIPPYSGNDSPSIIQHFQAFTSGAGRPVATNNPYITVAPRYRHGSSQGTLAQWQWAGLAKVTWGGTERRMRAYRDPHTGRNYFAFSQSQVFNSPTFGATGTDRIFNLGTSGEGHEQMYDIAVPSPDESHLFDYQIYALVLNKIVKIRFNNDPDSSTLEGADQDTRPAVTVIAEFTRHEDQEDIANRKYYVGDNFEGTRSRGLTWVDNVLFWATNLGIFAIDSLTGQRIYDLDNIFDDTGYPPNPRSGAGDFTHSDIDCAGLVYAGSSMYLLHHEHNDRERFTRSTFKVWDWHGDPVGRFATPVATTGTGAPAQVAGTLPSWVMLDDTEQSLEAPILRTSQLRNDGVDRTAEQQFTSRASGSVDLQIGEDLHTYRLGGRHLGDFLPAGVGLFDIGDNTTSAVRSTYSENVRATNIAPRVTFSSGDADTTGLHITGITEARGNLQSVRVFASIGDRTLAIPSPFVGQLSFITDPDERLLEMWDGATWVDIGGEHAGEHSDLSQVNTDIIPLVDNVHDLGSDSRRWAQAYVQDIKVSTIAPGTQHQSILWVGEADRGVVAFRGQTNFANASVRGVATGISHSLQYDDGDIELRLIDSASNVISTTTMTATQLAQSLGRYNAGNPNLGSVLARGPSNTPQWVRAASRISIVQATNNGAITLDLVGNDSVAMSGSSSVQITPNMVATSLSNVASTATIVIGGQTVRLSGTGEAQRFETTGDGTLANPAFAFSGHTSGLYSPAANNIGFVTGGEQRMRLTQHGRLVPNPLNVLSDTDPVGVLGEDANYHRWDLFGGDVNYQVLSQASSIDRKFGVVDATNDDVDAILNTRVRKFRYRDRPQDQMIGVVEEELPTTFFARKGEHIDIGSVVWSLVASLQWANQRLAWLQGRVSGSYPARQRGSSSNAGQGVAPSGWSNTGGGRRTT